jgi:hypothetical protein
MTLGKVLAGLVAIAVAMVVFKGLQDRPADPQEVKEAMAAEMDTLRTEADKRHPNLAKSEALQAVAAERASAQLAQQTGDKRALTAASLFYGFYFVNTRARPEYCRSHGVDLAPFAKAFDAVHAAERDRARALLLRNGTDPETLYPLMRDQLGVTVAQDMQDTAKGIQGSAADACRVLNEHAAQFAATLVLPPEVRQALMQ